MKQKIEPLIEVAVKRLIREQAQMLAEIEALRNKITRLETAIKLFSDAPTEALPVEETVKETILKLVRESGETGLKPKNMIERAAQRGVRLNRGSVYVILNRIERAGAVVREDGRYKLREFATESRTSG
jgi:hypothetical protein